MTETCFTEAYQQEALIRLAAIANYAIITIRGDEETVEERYPIAKTVIEDNFYKHYFEVGSEPIGTIEKVQVYNDNGVLMWEKQYEINKDDDGWHIATKIILTMQDLTTGG